MIALVGFTDLHIMQYLDKYTAILDEKGIEYEVIYWNRCGQEAKIHFRGNPVAYDRPMNTYRPFVAKICDFNGYAKFVRDRIREKKYEKLIVLTTQTGFILYDFLKNRYRKKYIFDYRDPTKEQVVPFYTRLVAGMFRNSACGMTSSFGYLEQVGIPITDKIHQAYNTQIACKRSPYHAKKNDGDVIRLVYWGMVRQVRFNKRFIDAFANDPRFELVFHGEGYYKDLEAYCKRKDYRNVRFTGRYGKGDIDKFVESADILHCAYQNDRIQKSALPVKLCDGIHYRLPMIISEGSYVDRYMKDTECCIRMVPGKTENLADRVYAWYRGLDIEAVERDYSRKENEIYAKDIEFRNTLIEFVDR